MVRHRTAQELLGDWLDLSDSPEPRRPRFIYWVSHWLTEGDEIYDSCDSVGPFQTLAQVMRAVRAHGQECGDPASGIQASPEITVFRCKPEWDGWRWVDGETITSGTVVGSRVVWSS